MPLEPDEIRADHTRRTAESESDDTLIGTTSEVQDNIAADFSLLGNVVDDAGDLPIDAAVRLAGRFTDPVAAQVWLDDGGLVTYDDTGSPNGSGLVWFLRFVDLDIGETFYQVYIKDESE